MKNNNIEFDKFSEDYETIIENDLSKFGINMDIGYTSKVFHLKSFFNDDPKSILDFGCGTGAFIPYLHEQFNRTKLYGCDVSSKSIDVAKEKYHFCEFKVIKNYNDLHYYKNIDCILINSFLRHIPQNEHESYINWLFNIFGE